MKTAVCISGKLDAIWNFDNIHKFILEPYKADVFIDTWIPFENATIKRGLSDEELIQAQVDLETIKELREYESKIPKPVVEEFAKKYQPKMMVLDHFDAIPLNHQIRNLLPKSKMTHTGFSSEGTKVENVLFMWYKIWKSNQLRKLYEQANRVRYDRIIRLRFDNSFTEFPIIEPKPKTLYIPEGGDFDGGLNDQLAIADSQTMDLYCELYPEMYRYAYAGIGFHPESLLRKHVEINRLNVERFTCGMHLRGREVTKDPRSMNSYTISQLQAQRFLDPNGIYHG